MFAAALVILALATTQPATPATQPAAGKVLFEEKFENLDHWTLEGLTDGASVKDRELRLDCKSKMGMHGVMAFCKQDFPDDIAIDFDFVVEQHNGLFITFVAMTDLNGGDALKVDPPRTGVFEDYYNFTRSYHVSVCRYEDDGKHTGVSNWRRNPGLHLMTSGKDWCTETGVRYHVKIIKRGPHCRVEVDGKGGAEFTDPQSMPGPIPRGGKFGFRAIGAKATFRVSNLNVTELPHE
jgi:Domain of unknown function (DUF1961)